MRFSYLSIIVAFLLLLDTDDTKLNLAQPAAGPAEAECVLYSEVFNEYMYAANFLFAKNFKRTVYTWRPISFVFGSRFDTVQHFSEKERKAVWFFEPVEGRPGIYYMKNLRYSEYLYTSQYHAGLFSPQRLVYTNNRVKPDWQESYMWRLVKEGIEEGRYAVWNVKYNEPLYPSHHVSRENPDDPRRDVYTWPLRNDKAPVSFYWSLKCRNNIYPQSSWSSSLLTS
jgi:hypothetical protein